MSEIESSFDAQRLKVCEYLKENNLGYSDVLRITDNIKNPKYKYRKSDISKIMNGRDKYTPRVNWLITIVSNAYGIK